MAGGGVNYTVTHFGPKEWLRHRGFIFEGELEFIPVVGRRGRVFVAEIQKQVAAAFEIPLSEMTSERRSREVARPRQVAMYLARKFTPRSLPMIGHQFGDRDHTTVMHAIRRVEELRANDAELNATIVGLERQLDGVAQ
jgi:chromosomal replication initiator protein